MAVDKAMFFLLKEVRWFEDVGECWLSASPWIKLVLCY